MNISKKQGIIGAVIVAAIIAFILIYFQPQTLFINTTAEESQQGQIVVRSAPDSDTVDVVEDEEMMEAAKSTWRSRDKETTGEVFLTQEGEKLFVRFENLNTSNGPDLFVYLAKDLEDNGRPIDFVNLGSLKANKGDSNYEVPSDVDINEYNYVVIWCERFSVSFADAAI